MLINASKNSVVLPKGQISWNNTESPEVNLYINGQLIFNRVLK